MATSRVTAGLSLALLLSVQDVAAAQRGEMLTVSSNTLLPCCIIEGMDSGAGLLTLRNTSSGELLRVQTPAAKYRVGQAVDRNTSGTAMALTPFPVEYQRGSKMSQNEAWKLHTRITTANNSRTNNWQETASAATVNKVRAVGIQHSYEPQVRLAASVGWIMENSRAVSLVLTCTRLENEKKGRRAAPRQALATQSGSSLIRCSE